MRILMDPLYTSRKISRCATHYALQKMADYFLKNIPDSVVYYILPSEDDDVTQFSVDSYIENDRIVYIRQSCYRDRYKEYYTLKRQWIDAFTFWGTHFDWDVLITMRSTMVPQIRFLSSKLGKRNKKIVIFDPLPLLDFKKTVSVREYMRVQTLSGYLNSDMVVVNAGHEKKGIMEDTRELMSFSTIKDMLELVKVKYLPPFDDLDYPNRKRERFCQDEKLRVLYTQRLDKSERRPDMAFDSFFYAFVTENKEKINFEVCTNSSIGDDPEYNGKYGFLRMSSPERSKFYEKLSNAHVFVSFAVEEGLPLSLHEAITHGVIGLVCRKSWSVDMFGEDYPWLIDNIDQATAHIKWIRENREKAYDMFLEWYNKKFLPSHADRMDFLPFMTNKLNEWEEEKRAKITSIEQDDGMLSTIIQNNTERFRQEDGTVDLKKMLYSLYSEKLIRCDFSKPEKGDIHVFNVPISRNESLYETVMRMKYVYGWKDYPKPGVYK